VNINDGSNEWIRFTNKNIRSVQFHPESFPGPTDSEYLFREFVEGL
jgi:carbamoyl-phosphate synthase small subunit